MAVNPANGGTTSPAAGASYSYDEGAAVALSAAANPGFRFVNWTGDVGGVPDPTSPSITVTMSGTQDDHGKLCSCSDI